MKCCPRFASHQSFLDPLETSDGRPYGPIRYQQIVKECYIISKNSNTSYNDVLKMTPTERESIIRYISDEFKKTQEAMEQNKNKQF